MLKQKVSSGGRRSSDEVSQSSCSSYSCEVSLSSRKLVTVAVKVFGACFGLKIERSARDEPVVDCKSPRSTFSGSSSHGSSHGSRLRRSSRGLYATGSDPSQRQSATFSGSSHGSSHGSRLRSSSRGLYATGSNPSQRQPGNKKFTLQEIAKATENFYPSLKIGEGGFGIVYKGILDDGTLIAVKRAKKGVRDNSLNLEFQTEIQALARVEHFNLVRFFGYVEQDEEKVVVLEYVPNGTLRENLDCLRGKPLDLAARLDIAIDIAHAVTYLHMYADHPIIHRDIKSSNVLLTETLRAKVTDFGFARFGISESDASFVKTQIKGTAGYLDPEYLKTFQLTEKSDVFSFGVLLVELMSGRRPIEPKRDRKERITANWAIKNFSEGNAKETLDPNLPESPATNFALEKILELAFRCMAPTRQNRPSMRRCAEILWRIRKYCRELLNSEPLTVPSQWKNASSNGRIEHLHLSSKSKNEERKNCKVLSAR